MKRSSMIRAVASSIALAVIAGTAAYAQPRLEIVGGDTYDWGSVTPGKLTTVVEVKNKGNEELKISDVRPGCGCTVAPIDKTLLKPGEIGKISIALDVATKSGAVEKYVTITSNDAANPTQTLHLKANVRRALTFAPAQFLMVNDGKMGVETASSTVTIKNTSDKPFTIETPQLAAGGNVAARFDMNGSRELKPGEEFALKAYVTPKEAQSMHGSVTMKTSNSEMPSVELLISGTMAQANAPQLSGTAQK